MSYSVYLESKKTERSNTLSSMVSLYAILTQQAEVMDKLFEDMAFGPLGTGKYLKRFVEDAAAISGRGFVPAPSFFSSVAAFESQLRNAVSTNGDGDLYPEIGDQDINTSATRWNLSFNPSSTSASQGASPYQHILWVDALPRTETVEEDDGQGGTSTTTNNLYPPKSPTQDHATAVLNALASTKSFIQGYLNTPPDPDDPLFDVIDEIDSTGAISSHLSTLNTISTANITNARDALGLTNSSANHSTLWAAIETLKAEYKKWDDTFTNSHFTSTGWSSSGSLTFLALWRLIIRSRVEKPTGTLTGRVGLENTIADKQSDVSSATNALAAGGTPLSEILPTPSVMASFYIPVANADREITHTTGNLIALLPAHAHVIDIYRASEGIWDYMVDPSAVEAQWASPYTTSVERMDDVSNALKGVWKEIIPKEDRGKLYWYRIAARCDGSIPPLGSSVPSPTASRMSSIFKNDTPHAGVVSGVKEIRNVGLASRIEFPGPETADDYGILKGGYVMLEGRAGVHQVASLGEDSMYIYPAIEDQSVSNVGVHVVVGMINAYSLPEEST